VPAEGTFTVRGLKAVGGAEVTRQVTYVPPTLLLGDGQQVAVALERLD
jgi:hypothetical protein